MRKPNGMNTMKAAMKRVESSRVDKARDKKAGIKEGSPADMKADMAQPKLMARKPFQKGSKKGA